MLAISRIEESPTERLSVNRAYIINDLAAYYEKHSLDPVDKKGSIMAAEETLTNMSRHADERTQLVVLMMLAIIVISLLGFFLYPRLSKSRLLSLWLINVLIAVFLLFILLTPEGHKKGWLAVLVFAGLFSMFRIMSYFESKGD